MPIPLSLVVDLDDTILDYTAPAEALWPRLYRDFARRMGVSEERLRQAADESRRWYWSDAERFREGRLDLKRARRFFIRMAFEKLGRTDFETADELADAFTREREEVVKPFDGALEALERFRRGGARMVLLTNGASSLQRNKIERFGLARYFRDILIEGETGIGKPDPRAFRAALASLETAPHQAWMVGDDPEIDLRPAKAIGMHTVWIRGSAGEKENPADLAVTSLRELIRHWEEAEI